MIRIIKESITNVDTDAIVNAANSHLKMGGGVCGAIFFGAGISDLQEACDEIGFCEVGNAVITPAFRLKAKYIIHTVGPRWRGGNQNEPELLYDAYKNSLILAKENQCHSISFPLISAGIFRYPMEEAWKVAINSCYDFLCNDSDWDMNIIFTVINDNVLAVGRVVLDSYVM